MYLRFAWLGALGTGVFNVKVVQESDAASMPEQESA
jgi:hypothetical protein